MPFFKTTLYVEKFCLFVYTKRKDFIMQGEDVFLLDASLTYKKYQNTFYYFFKLNKIKRPVSLRHNNHCKCQKGTSNVKT